ncbi:MAG: tripartite tricarboxylate transporter TctB family protein, partial [Deltaproteobacteria bacterium]
MMMNLRDRWSGLFWLAISIFVCIEAYQIDIGTFHSPGPGFLPFWAAVIFGVFSVVVIATSFLRRPEEGKVKHLWKGKNWDKVII